MNNINNSAIVVAAGKGERLQQNIPKCLVSIEGFPLYFYSLFEFITCPKIDELIVVTPPSRLREFETYCAKFYFTKKLTFVVGGEQRHHSAMNGIKALTDCSQYVLIHDGARPFVSQNHILQVLASLKENCAATVVSKISDTLHKFDNGYLTGSADRNEFVTAQTPQGFRVNLLKQAFSKIKEGDTYTDEITLIREKLREMPFAIVSNEFNAKITNSNDIDDYRHLFVAKSKLIKEITNV